jgi:hypothetical protein
LLGLNGSILRYSDFELFWKTDMRRIVLDQKKNSKNILEKAFFKFSAVSSLKVQ